MRISIDPELRTPVHQQIVDEVKRLVGAGVVQPGATMPSVRELSHTLGIEPDVVAHAYRELAREGLLHTPGKKRAVVRAAGRRLTRAASRVRLTWALDSFFARLAVCELDEEEINAAFQRRLAEFRSGGSARP
jgi:GntR family transcriptional regulator